MKQRKAYVVYVNLDPVPGAFHTAESALNNLRGILCNRLPSYNPEVAYPPESIEKVTDYREAFIVYIDLDDMPGAMHSKESAQHTIATVLRSHIGHYRPLVSLAPNDLQPVNTEGIN